MFSIPDNPAVRRLPASLVASRVAETLKAHGAAVVTAPPGAGKSTVLPLCLEGHVLMLEPRRIAARHIAERMAWLLGEQVGQTVGYRVRFENKVGKDTRIEVLTEGILTRRLLEDPSLEGVDTVIFDEFHERSLICDEALALVRQTREILRPDLKILIMSATIDADGICRALDCPVVECEGRMFDVRVEYASKAPAPGPELRKAMAAAISRMHREEQGDILAFLPGEADIRAVAQALEGHFEGTDVFPLHGTLPPEAQRRAVQRGSRRKIVLATPVAETSITIEGVRIVVDSGYCKTPVFDSRTGLGHLETVRISEDMARQRAGRAGRTQSGVCVRLWPADERLKPMRDPEILSADLASLALDLAVWGSADLPWITPPPAHSLARAKSLLEDLGAIDSEGRVTARGRRLSGIPCHPRIASMLALGGGLMAAQIAAVVEDKDPLPGAGADVALRLDRADRRAVEQFLKYSGSGHVLPDAGLLIAAAYPERVAKSCGTGEYLLSGGGEQQQVRLDRNDPLCAFEWLSVARVEGGFIRLAAPVDPTLLPLRERDNVGWDPREGKVVSRRESRIGKLLVSEKPLACSRVQADAALCEAALRYGVTMFDFASVENLQRRVAAAALWHPELSLPSLATEDVLARPEDWVPWAAAGRTTVQDLRKADLEKALWSLLSYEQQCAVDRIAPSHVTVPTGSRIMLEYRVGAPAPVLRVRLQECFGLVDTPLVDGRPVLMELLSPGFKPVQLTSDLRSFWSGTYFEVRAELRRRYPRHSWPDNPLEAEPVRGVKRK